MLSALPNALPAVDEESGEPVLVIALDRSSADHSPAVWVITHDGHIRIKPFDSVDILWGFDPDSETWSETGRIEADPADQPAEVPGDFPDTF